MKIKHAITKHAIENETIFNNLCKNNNYSISEYIIDSKMNNEGTWATDIEVLVSAHLFEIDIFIYVNEKWNKFESNFFETHRKSKKKILH